MKYIIYLLVGLIAVTLLAPNVKFENIKTKETNSITSTSEVKAESVKESVKDVNTTEVAKDTPPVDIVKTNPNGCNQDTEWIWEDGSCHAKEVSGSIAPSTTAPSTARSSGGCELVYKYSSWDQNVAHAVCLAESGGNSNAANYNDNHGSCVGSFGLMQLACFWIPNPSDPEANMAKANEIYNSSGWSPWGAYTSGKYLKYL